MEFTPEGLPKTLNATNPVEDIELALLYARGLYDVIKEEGTHVASSLGHAIAIAEETLSDSRVLPLTHREFCAAYQLLVSSILVVCLNDAFESSRQNR